MTVFPLQLNRQIAAPAQLLPLFFFKEFKLIVQVSVSAECL